MALGPPERRLLFAGDMQFADAESGAELGALTSALWQDVLDAGPFAFVKLSHHGSDNANPHVSSRTSGETERQRTGREAILSERSLSNVGKSTGGLPGCLDPVESLMIF